MIGPIIDSEGPDRVWFYSKSAGQLAGDDVAHKRATFVDWDTALGQEKDIFRDYGLDRRLWETAVRDLMDHKRLVGDILEERGAFYDRWKKDRAFALAAYVTATVVTRRLAEVGKGVQYEV